MPIKTARFSSTCLDPLLKASHKNGHAIQPLFGKAQSLGKNSIKWVYLNTCTGLNLASFLDWNLKSAKIFNCTFLKK